MLPEDEKEVILIITTDLNKAKEVANEYLEVFPNILLAVTTGFFKSEVSKAKKLL